MNVTILMILSVLTMCKYVAHTTVFLFPLSCVEGSYRERERGS